MHWNIGRLDRPSYCNIKLRVTILVSLCSASESHIALANIDVQATINVPDSCTLCTKPFELSVFSFYADQYWGIRRNCLDRHRAIIVMIVVLTLGTCIADPWLWYLARPYSQTRELNNVCSKQYINHKMTTEGLFK